VLEIGISLRNGSEWASQNTALFVLEIGISLRNGSEWASQNTHNWKPRRARCGDQYNFFGFNVKL